MTADTTLLSRTDRERLAQGLAELDVIDREMRRPGTLAATCEPQPLHRSRAVTTLAVTSAVPTVGGLTAPARAVPPVRPAGERPAAPGTDARCPVESLLELSAQVPDRHLGGAQLVDHPRLHGHLPDEGIEVLDAAGQNEIRKSSLRGVPGHVTTIAVTPPERTAT
jgi:hypothetical protein